MASTRASRRIATTLATLLLGLGLSGFAAEAGAASNGAAANVLEPLDVFGLQWASDPQVAPDGRSIAYVRQGFDIMRDRRASRIWLLNVDGSAHRPLSDRAGFAPRFSPDGSRIAFLSSTEEGTELYMHWLADSRTARISQLPESRGDLAWSPDGREIAFTMFKAADAEPMASVPQAPEGAKWAPGFKVFEAVQYRVDGQGYLRPGFTHVYVIAADGGAPRQVTSGDFHHAGGLSWARQHQLR